MSEASDEYRGLKQTRIDKIVELLNSFNYSENELTEQILPYIGQWLYDNYINIESTCLIISSIVNYDAEMELQDKINNIYEGVILLSCKSHLQSYLSKNEYKELEKLLEPRKHAKVLTGELDDTTNIVINYKLQQVLKETTFINRKGEMDSKFTSIVEAVPIKTIVYDSPLLDQPRTFKLVWSSKVSQRNFTITGEGTGATISEISNYLVNSGFSHNPRQVDGAVACMINTLIKEKVAEIKTDIDNPGVYYNPEKDKVTVVKKTVRIPTREEMARTAKSLHELSQYYEGHESTLATVLKWCMMSLFSYAMKQAGNNMEWLYLKGTSQSGKTTLSRIGLFIHGEPADDVNDIGGTSVDTVARLGAVVSKSCDPVIVNEPASVFNRKATREMIKLCVQSTVARSKFIGSTYGGIPAFAPILFTANMYLPEDDAIINRMHVITFSYNQRKSDFEKKEFENKFHVKSPHLSQLKSLNYLGEYALQYIVTEPGLLLGDWRETADKILSQFYFEMGSEVPEWLTLWEESETINDLDDTQREDIRNFFVQEFNNARKKINVYTSDGDRSVATLDVDEATTSTDFTDVNWSIVNNRMLTWAIPFTSRHDNKYICLTQGLRKTLGDHLDYCADLKSIGELLGWDVKSVRAGSKGKVMKVIKIPFDDFMEFLYPNIELEGNV